MATTHTGRPVRPLGSRLRTLVVDDSESARAAICSAAAGNPSVEIIATANNGREALEKVRHWRPKLVVMDVHMPVMNGIAAAEQLQREFPDTLILLLSLDDGPELRSLCRSSGAYAFVHKAFLVRELPGALEAALTHLKSESAHPGTI